MKAVWSIGLCMFLLTACLREHDNMEDCRADLFFKMQAVPVSYTHLTLPTNSRV